jgi:hypothetical protein
MIFIFFVFWRSSQRRQKGKRGFGFPLSALRLCVKYLLLTQSSPRAQRIFEMTSGISDLGGYAFSVLCPPPAAWDF